MGRAATLALLADQQYTRETLYLYGGSYVIILFAMNFMQFQLEINDDCVLTNQYKQYTVYIEFDFERRMISMSYSTATSQAVSILLFIHFKSDEGLYDYLSTKVISEMLNIPAPTAVKVLNKLNAAGLTHTKEGAKGGILLAKPISDVTFLDVFNAVEQGKPLFKIQYDFNIEYEGLDAMKEKGIRSLQDAEDAMKASLSGVSLLDLIY